MDILLYPVVIILIAKTLTIIKNKNKQQQENNLIYQVQFLHTENDETSKRNLQDDALYSSGPVNEWDYKFVTISTVSLVLGSIPWLIVNARGIQDVSRGAEIALPVCFYAIYINVVAVVCVYIRYGGVSISSCFKDSTSSSPSSKETTKESLDDSSTQDLVGHMEGEESYGTFE